MSTAQADPDTPGRFVYRVFLPLISGPQSATSTIHTKIHTFWAIQGSFEYVVQPGDTLISIAIDLGRDLTDMACATRSAGESLDTLRPGQVLSIPALGTVCHVVREGDTLESLAALYGVPVAVIVDNAWNQLSGPPYVLVPGQRLRITGALDPRFIPQPTASPRIARTDRTVSTPLPSELWPYGDGRFIWPIQGTITQGFSNEHRGIDIAADLGDVVVAADTGTVIKAGWNDQGLGYRVVIDHHIDYITLYAHLSAVLVHEGEVVKKGQPIGLAGATGNATGVHLHFAILDYGIATDPLNLLPPR
ncbi:MAG: M23 family metallopeptidase [Anaerolineae bacterium]|nr:M23 family metallopeptidase [Anaerolineae bacterium]